MPSEVKFSIVSSESDYLRVLALRHQCYNDVGKIKPHTTIEAMGDAYDRHSQIVIGSAQGEIVCSVRIIYHQNDEPLEQEQFVTWPNHLPPRTQIAEVTRACIRRDYRGTDAFIRMLRFFGTKIVGERIPHVVICASDEMAAFYRKAGARLTGLSYPHKDLNNTLHHILIADVDQVVKGRGLSPISWCLLWKEPFEKNRDCFRGRLNPLDVIRVHVFRMFQPAADTLLVLKIKLRERTLQRRTFHRITKTEKTVHVS